MNKVEDERGHIADGKMFGYKRCCIVYFIKYIIRKGVKPHPGANGYVRCLKCRVDKEFETLWHDSFNKFMGRK